MPTAQRELSGKLAGLSLPRQVIFLAVWPFFEQVLNLLVGTNDLLVAGHLPHIAGPAVDALGVGGIINWFMGVVLGSLGIGSTAIIARAIGARHKSLANAALGQSVLICLAIGMVLGIGLFVLAYPIGLLAGRHGETMTLFVQFLHILVLAAPAQAILLVGGACLRGAGDTRTPFLIMLVVNVVNAAATILLVFGPTPIGGHAIRGIAAGTAIAWYLGAVVILIVMARGVEPVKLYLHRLRPHLHTVKRILRVGIPSMVENVGGTWLATAIVMVIVGHIPGKLLIGSHMIAVRVESFSFQPGFALGIAAATLVGQYLGLDDADRARKAAVFAWAIAASLMTCVGLIFVFIPHLLASLITHNHLLVTQAAPLIRICGVIQFFFATSLVLSFALRGAGDTRTTMKLTYLSVFLIRVPGAFLLGYVFGLGLPGVWYALCADLTFRGCLFAARFFHGGWQTIQV